jgi:flavin-binding protein dodecin
VTVAALYRLPCSASSHADRSLSLMENTMSKVMKVIEVLAESPESWEDAVTAAVAKASESVHGIRSVYVKNFEAQIDNDKVVNYRINAKVTFEVD